MKRAVKKKISPENIKQALVNSGGFISGAAVQLNISPSNICNRIAKNKKLQLIRDEIRESYLDLGETKLIEKVNAGDLGAICFYLKCQGKARGYVEQQRIDMTHLFDEPLIEIVRKLRAEKDGK